MNIPVRFSSPLRSLEWLSPARVKALERFGITTVGDLLTHFPRRYENRMRFDTIPREESAQPVCVCGQVAKVSQRRLPGRRLMIDAILQEPQPHALSSTIICRWFNAFYVQKMVAVGSRMVVYGKPKRVGRQIVIDHPDFEILEEGDDRESPHFNRITPIYPATEGITPRQFRSWLYRLQMMEGERLILAHPLPEGLQTMPYLEALRSIHFPESYEALERARRELVLAEFFEMQLFIAARRAENTTRTGASHCGDGRLVRAFHEQLPFPLTRAQQRAVEEIRRDLASPRPMNRMLHGDVGSGKTVVALSAMLSVVEAGYQAALMAPTQILAEQHYLNFKRWLEPLGVNIALRTGNRREESSLPLFNASEEPQIVVGTHALLYDAPLPRLGLAVIDEQHKFGVMQRAALLGEGTDVLMMTATPIPRTLTMTVYGDLDVSTLDELPAGRGKIITAARDPSKLPDAIEFMKKHLAAGRQVYVVYPLIEASPRLEVKAATAEFEKWQSALAPYRCELLHGRMPAAEKEAVMERFRRNESQVLVATTVIEVGIDVPNANIMLIEDADRFGLAQLHQLRGRIGRGSHKSYCILIHSAGTPEGLEKMKTMEATSNGFEIAEADFRLRGAGELLGTAQSGHTSFKLGDLIRDAALMHLARQAAIDLFAVDPELAQPAHRRFRETLAEQRKLFLAKIS
mgnify:CR=1 FL=1